MQDTGIQIYGWVDPAGNIYVAGYTSASDFPVTPGAYQTRLNASCPYPSSAVATGFIGTNKSCSLQTVQAVVADFNDGKLADPVVKPAELDKLVQDRQPDAVNSAGWRAIDAAEVLRGIDEGRPRNKFTDIADMLAAAATTPPPAEAAPPADTTASSGNKPIRSVGPTFLPNNQTR